MMKLMTVCIKLLSVLALLMAVRMAGAQPEKTGPTEAQRRQEVPHKAAARYRNTPGAARRTAELISKKSIADVRLMYLRQDANAILNLDAKPIEAAPTPVVVVSEAPVVKHKPTLAELKTELKAVQGQYNAAKLELRAASRSKDAARADDARATLKATQQTIASLKGEIKALEPKRKAAKKPAPRKKAQQKPASIAS